MIWEPFVLALVLGLVVSGGLYYAYLWPSVEPLDDGDVASPLQPALALGHSERTGAAVAAVQESRTDELEGAVKPDAQDAKDARDAKAAKDARDVTDAKAASDDQDDATDETDENDATDETDAKNESVAAKGTGA